NDRGPFGNGRIIDLDKVAFAEIASVGAGVVNVKMEVITN
ncbi:MAG: septal ring lytic transglycosylase RlpA family protein, partial [Candidatus Moranbacteria bacterium]|nr:septal ring lytic transglycosylase RlpA family protein [Candidatus Moranbacteria bacterium]